MKRPIFFLMLSIPFLLVNIIKDEPAYFLLAGIYIWLIQLARLLYVGLGWGKALLAFTPFGLKYWAKMWEMDTTKSIIA